MMLTPTQSALAEHARRHYAAWAARPYVLGNWGSFFALWARGYEAKNALAARNQSFANSILPAGGDQLPLPAQGVPESPRAVRWALDEARPGTVTVRLDVSGAVSATLINPLSPTPLALVASLVEATRSTFTFPADRDGLYAIKLVAGTSVLATLYIPVMRGEWKRLREYSRQSAYQFSAIRPAPSAAFTAHLALLGLAEAAARTGQPVLFATIAAYLAARPSAPTPTALFPRAN